MVGHNLSYVYHETLLEGDVLANSVKIKLVITFTFEPCAKYVSDILHKREKHTNSTIWKRYNASPNLLTMFIDNQLRLSIPFCVQQNNG